jgi:hypothetical protein
MTELFTLGADDHHAVADPGCPACPEGYPEPCPCGGRMHAATGDADIEGTPARHRLRRVRAVGGSARRGLIWRRALIRATSKACGFTGQPSPGRGARCTNHAPPTTLIASKNHADDSGTGVSRKSKAAAAPIVPSPLCGDTVNAKASNS